MEEENKIDITKFDYEDLQLLNESLKALLREQIEMNFKYLSKITKLGLTIEEEIELYR